MGKNGREAERLTKEREKERKTTLGEKKKKQIPTKPQSHNTLFCIF